MGPYSRIGEIIETLDKERNVNPHEKKYNTGIYSSVEKGQIVFLDLKNQNLTKVPDTLFSGLSSLSLLSFYGNKIVYLPENLFSGLTNLKTLNLSDNQLVSLPAGIFEDLNSLVSLSLFENNLTNLPRTIFNNLTSLESLNLSRNKIESLPTGIFDPLIELSELHLVDNPIIAGLKDKFNSIDEYNLNLDVIATRSKRAELRQQKEKEIMRVTLQEERKLDRAKLSQSLLEEQRRMREEEPKTQLKELIYQIIWDATPGIPIQLTRIMDLISNSHLKSKREIEELLLEILIENPKLGEYYTYEQVFIRNKREIPKSIINEERNPSSKICYICNKQINLLTDVTNCRQCNSVFHFKHLYNKIQSTGKCPVCKKSLV